MGSDTARQSRTAADLALDLISLSQFDGRQAPPRVGLSVQQINGILDVFGVTERGFDPFEYR